MPDRAARAEAELSATEEIKITPEMLRAGSEMYSLHSTYGVLNEDDAAESIFKAMISASTQFRNRQL